MTHTGVPVFVCALFLASFPGIFRLLFSVAFLAGNPVSSVCVVIRVRPGHTRKSGSIYSRTSIPASGLTVSPVHCLPDMSPSVKSSELKADYTSPSGAEIKNVCVCVCVCVSVPPLS
jgi:hypothetical protein